MKKAVWGPIIWKTLHCLTYKIKDEHFPTQKTKLIDIIIKICSNLPCPVCSNHAQGMIKKYRLQFIKNKQDLIRILFFMHNEVNKRLKKVEFKFDNLTIYDSLRFRDVLTEYYNTNINMHLGEKMMLYSFHRKKFLTIFKEYVNQNIQYFSD